MGHVLENFTVTRNILGENADVSAARVRKYIELVGSGLDGDAYAKLSKGQRNDISALASYTGVFCPGPEGGYIPTELNKFYQGLQEVNATDAWQWLITRSLWHFALPNGSSSPLNKITRELGIKFFFFKSLLSLLSMLSALPGKERFLYFHEFCILFDEDENWSDDATSLFNKILSIRHEGSADRKRGLLGDLEDKYGIKRDNLNTVIVKAFSQTGLFDFEPMGVPKVGVALSNNLSGVLQRRLRHVLDSDLVHADPETEWLDFLATHKNELPLEVEQETPANQVDAESVKNISSLCADAHTAFTNAGLIFKDGILPRFVGALLTKRFLILTGLSGSGKTKIAHAFATWISKTVGYKDPFEVGSKIGKTYTVTASDQISIEFSNSEDPGEGQLVTLPRGLIKEWADYLEANSSSRDMPAQQIRDLIKPISKYGKQMNSFETHLKPAAIALLDHGKETETLECYRLIPVGADWTSNENVLGYQDALQNGIYRKPASGALDLILRARNDKERPYFLILDEMNLSHVERYFADILSAIESGGKIPLHSSLDDLNKGELLTVPSELALPNNLFIIGTVNIDETTYMFSPKVLDRANVIEFRATKEELAIFLTSPTRVKMDELAGKGAGYGPAFVTMATAEVSLAEIPPEIEDGIKVAEDLNARLAEIFGKLAPLGAEFGFRAAFEITRFVFYHATLSGPGWDPKDALDAQVFQKLMPKLHGSDRKLRPTLDALKAFCTEYKLILSLEKTERMLERLTRDGFTSFAEA